MANQKVIFVNSLLAKVTALAKICDDADDLYGAYTDRGYAPAGANPIVDGDLANGQITNITAAQIPDLMNLLAQITAFANNQAVFQSNWKYVMNKGRTDI
jgi:hypothetical protein